MSVSNVELRKQLKRVDNLLHGVGYEFHVAYGSFFIQPKCDNSENPQTWVRLSVRKNYSPDYNSCKMFFTAEPCRLSGGSGYIDVDFAEAICSHWKRLLNLCNTLNAMNIVAPEQEIRDLLIDIYSRKRKD